MPLETRATRRAHRFPRPRREPVEKRRQANARVLYGAVGAHAEGSALLLVVGATAAIGALAAALLTASFIAYETAALRHDGIQARLLAESALDMLGADIAGGRVGLPARVGDSVLRTGNPPSPPAGFAAPKTRGGGICGFQVRLTPVPGPTGLRRRQLAPSGPGALLINAAAEGWCGRGYFRREARFAVADDLSVVRLY